MKKSHPPPSVRPARGAFRAHLSRSGALPSLPTPGLLIMVCLAERLPVALIPEQALVATVRYDMVHDSCLGDLACLLAVDTERMPSEVAPPGSLPGRPIPSLR